MDPEPNTAGADAPAPADRTQTIERRSGSGEHPQTPGNPTPATAAPEVDAEYVLPEGDPDRYTNKGEHARGGLGRVLRAHDHRLGRTVAIKELLQTSSRAEVRFVREALITARLQHPGVVPVHEAGRWPNGDPYYVMKLISGRSMRELIRARPGLDDRLALLPNIIAVAETIAYAHSEGIIHRDIKPANVVVGDFGETVVVDWGIAKDRRGQVAPPTELEVAAGGNGTHTAGVLGTPAYMPPEQANGDEVDERADVYAVGALLYELLAGEQPYSGEDSGDVLARVIAGPPRPLQELQPSTPPDLLAVVRKAMAREPAGRYRTAKELAEDLKRFQTGKLVTAHDYSTMTLFRRWMWRNRGLVAACVIALGVVSVLGVLAVGRILDERNLARTERAQAEAATRSTEKRRLQLLLLQAKSSLDRDPTAAVAWLKTYPEDGPGLANIRSMVDEAEARGVARHVFRLGDWGFDVEFSPDGRLLATSSKDKTVRLYDVETGDSRVLARLDTPVHSVAFAPDGASLATGEESGEVKLWQLDGREIASAHGHLNTVTGLQFSPDGRRLVSATEHYYARIWDTATMEPVLEIRGSGNLSPSGDALFGIEKESGEAVLIDVADGSRTSVPKPPEAGYRVAVSNGGRQIAALGTDSKVRVLVVGDSRGWVEVGQHPGKVDNLQFSPSGKLLVSMGFDKTIRVIELERALAAGAGEMLWPDVLRGHDDAIYMVAFSADERAMVSAGDDGTARVWDLATGQSRALRGHDDDVYRVAISPDDSLIATVSLDSSARVWHSNFADDARLRHSDAVGHVQFAADGSLVSHTFAGTLWQWSLGDGKGTKLGEAAMMMKRRPTLSPDGRLVVARSGDAVRLWDLVNGGEAVNLAAPDGSFTEPQAHVFSPDSKSLLVTYGSGHIVIWSLADREPRLLARGDKPGPAAFSPAGDEVAVAHMGGLTVWSLVEEKVVLEVDVAEGRDFYPKNNLQYSGDGRWLALFNHAGEIVIFDRRSRQRRVLRTGDDKLIHTTFSPDGAWIAAAAADRTVRLWRTETGEQRVLKGHTDLVHYVAFSPDSSSLASGSYDKTVRLWDPETGYSRVLRGHTMSVDGVAFSLDGNTLASASRDSTVRLWDVRQALRRDTRQEVRSRLEAATTAVLAPDNRPETAAR